MNPDEIAQEILEAWAARRPMASLAARMPGFGLDEAYQVTAALRRLRQARGERSVGRKIGFTNRTIWAEYQVYAPIWGDMYATTLQETDGKARVDLAPYLEPRLEPEIAFGLTRAPKLGMDEAALLGCIGWVAHGFEIVHSLFPGWRFAAADTVAAFALHGAYRMGPRVPIDRMPASDWLDALTKFEISLYRDDTFVDRGRAVDVLDGPLSALRHLNDLLTTDQHNPLLAAGEIITTGTVTRAYPVEPGQTWRTALHGIDLPPMTIHFAS